MLGLIKLRNGTHKIKQKKNYLHLKIQEINLLTCKNIIIPPASIILVNQPVHAIRSAAPR